ncbi:hypothetical protein [Methanosarcina lacustris]|nr:hypothetical protein [Methanosarcina lacustris]
MKSRRKIKGNREVSKLAGERARRKKEVRMCCVPDDLCNKGRVSTTPP